MNTESLAETTANVLRLAAARGWRIATAESITSGLVCAHLTQTAGASTVVSGGVVVYTDEMKAALLGISASDLATHGVYSEWTARAMAQAIRERSGAEIGVGTTGVAGPGANQNVAAGSVFIAVITPDTALSAPLHVTGDRDCVRTTTAADALRLLARALAPQE